MRSANTRRTDAGAGKGPSHAVGLEQTTELLDCFMECGWWPADNTYQ